MISGVAAPGGLGSDEPRSAAVRDCARDTESGEDDDFDRAEFESIDKVTEHPVVRAGPTGRG